jgi:hypothetical protein
MKTSKWEKCSHPEGQEIPEILLTKLDVIEEISTEKNIQRN